MTSADRVGLPQSLLGITKELSFARDIAEVRAVIRSYARELIASDGITFILKEGEECHYCEEDAIAPLWKGRKFPLSDCISGWVMLNGQPAAIEDIYSDSRIPFDAYRPTFVKSLAMVPVRREDPMAAIGAYWATPHLATAEEMSILQFLADSTALALRNVQLYSDLQETLAREQNARRKAENVNRAKDEWISVLSHELRTPLTPIIGWAGILKREQNMDKVRQAASAIERNAIEYGRLINDLIDTSEILASKLEVVCERTDFAAAVKAALVELRRFIDTSGVRVTHYLDSSMVMGDPRRLQQIAFNLVHNAIKFTPREGGIDVSLQCAADAAELIVRDTGTGIGRDILYKMFDRFEIGDPSSTRKAGGLGLGLWITRHLVVAHHGTVSAQSEGNGLGATFRVRLPLIP